MALLFDPGAPFVASLFGALSAGRSYVALDPAYPVARSRFVVEDAGATLIVCDAANAERAHELAGPERPVLAFETLQPPSDESSLAGGSIDDVAYVLYTSGSEGAPKGVLQTHRGVLHHSMTYARAMGIGPQDRVTLLSSPTFDGAVLDIFGALLSGATLCPAPLRVWSLPDLLTWLDAQAITVYHSTPSAFRYLAEGLTRGMLSDVRTVVLGGEDVLPSDVRLQRKHFGPSTGLWNLYGMSESSLALLHAVTDADGADATGRVPIGRPVDATEVRLLDATGGPQGRVGEIAIIGQAVAPGYWKRDSLSTSAFSPDPDGTERTLYRTGDLGRERPDGTLEFVGRKDAQFKLHGYRVEPREIELALEQHEQVRAAATAVRVDDAGRQRLVGYVLIDEGQAPPSTGALRAAARTRLPDYMVPSAFMCLDALPLTPNGKLDRRALPQPDWRRPTLAGRHTEPRTPLERELVQLWASALGVERVGVHHAFLDLGGDSLRAAAVVNTLQSRLGETLYVTALFEAPTVAELAEYLEQHYADSVPKLTGQAPTEQGAAAARVTVEQGARLRALIPALPRRAPDADVGARNAPAVFLLSAPRSGSTLLRAMLAGHGELFSPPELGLLSFETLAERASACTGRYAFMREGLLRAIMSLHECDAARAMEIMAPFEQEGTSVRAFYAELQAWAGSRLLVDKTAAYSNEPSILRRAEQDFDGALYVHLVRHPGAVTRSFLEVRLDRIFRHEQPFSPRHLGELLWQISNENILEFLQDVPASRQLHVRYEDLVTDPRETLERICGTLGVAFDEAMLDPYGDPDKRMTNGLYEVSRGIGDIRFQEHRRIDPAVAERWRKHLDPAELGERTRALAPLLGYEDLPAPEAAEPGQPQQAATAGVAITQRPLGHQVPLSFAQQRLWFVEQLVPGTGAYHLLRASRWQGPLDLTALQRSLDEIVRRHEALRTTFAQSGGEPCQVVSETGVFPLRQEQAPDNEDATEVVARVVREESGTAFDLTRGPLVRARIVRISDEDHVLVYDVHHIVADGVSLELLWDELVVLYRAFVAQRQSPLPRLPIQYGDFACWQRSPGQEADLARLLPYWQEQLRDVATLELPVDRARPLRPSFQGAVESIRLPAALTDAVRTCGREHGATVFMVLLAAFKALLQRYSGQTDLVVGSPIAARRRSETQPLIGFFVDMLVLRTDLSQDPSFAALLGRVRKVALEAYEHSELPFERLIEALVVDRDQSRNPLFQVSFSHRQQQERGQQVPGLHVDRLPIDAGTVRFDLEVRALESDEHIDLSLTYATELFDAATIRSLAERFQRLLEIVLSDSARPLSQIKLITDAERQLLATWNDTVRDHPRDGSIHGVFAEQVSATPDAVALVFGELQWTYAQLDRRANQLAHQLQAWGVGHEDFVGLCVERSLEMVVGVLAILKAGGAYVPLDPSYPSSRLEFMLQDTGATLLLTQEELRAQLPAFDGTIVTLDTLAEELAQWPESAPRSEAAANSLAYVIYTSGSTGRPKGVCVEHRSVLRLVSNTNYVELGPDEVFLQFAPISFDASTFELWGSLLNGSRLVIVQQQPSLQQLADTIAEHGVTTLWLTAALFKQMADLHADQLGGVRQLLAGGEELSSVHVQRFLATLEDRRLINGYGPTENTTFTCCHVMTRHTRIGRSVPIGPPVTNTQVYVLDEDMQLSPVGIPGRLYAGGDGLARCYLNDAELTARKFVQDPFRDDPGARLYDIGDQARWLPDGTLEFLGRKDHQVKLRGFRIELGEIETALVRHPALREAAVLCQGEASGDKKLVAYVVPVDSSGADPSGAELQIGDLRQHLMHALPSYMVPSTFAVLDRLPLSANGKLDRAALGRIDAVQTEEQGEYVEPRTPTEERIALIWAGLLGVDRVGIHDDFFVRGGHSLMAMQVISRLREELEVELPVQEMFSSPTVAGLAEVVDVLRWAATDHKDPDVVVDGEDFEL